MSDIKEFLNHLTSYKKERKININTENEINYFCIGEKRYNIYNIFKYNNEIVIFLCKNIEFYEKLNIDDFDYYERIYKIDIDDFNNISHIMIISDFFIEKIQPFNLYINSDKINDIHNIIYRGNSKDHENSYIYKIFL